MSTKVIVRIEVDGMSLATLTYTGEEFAAVGRPQADVLQLVEHHRIVEEEKKRRGSKKMSTKREASSETGALRR